MQRQRLLHQASWCECRNSVMTAPLLIRPPVNNVSYSSTCIMSNHLPMRKNMTRGPNKRSTAANCCPRHLIASHSHSLCSQPTRLPACRERHQHRLNNVQLFRDRVGDGAQAGIMTQFRTEGSIAAGDDPYGCVTPADDGIDRCFQQLAVRQRQ